MHGQSFNAIGSEIATISNRKICCEYTYVKAMAATARISRPAATVLDCLELLHRLLLRYRQDTRVLLVRHGSARRHRGIIDEDLVQKGYQLVDRP